MKELNSLEVLSWKVAKLEEYKYLVILHLEKFTESRIAHLPLRAQFKHKQLKKISGVLLLLKALHMWPIKSSTTQRSCSPDVVTVIPWYLLH